MYLQYLSAWSPFFVIPVGMLAAAVVERSLQVCHIPCRSRRLASRKLMTTSVAYGRHGLSLMSTEGKGQGSR